MCLHLSAWNQTAPVLGAKEEERNWTLCRTAKGSSKEPQRGKFWLLPVVYGNVSTGEHKYQTSFFA